MSSQQAEKTLEDAQYLGPSLTCQDLPRMSPQMQSDRCLKTSLIEGNVIACGEHGGIEWVYTRTGMFLRSDHHEVIYIDGCFLVSVVYTYINHQGYSTPTVFMSSETSMSGESRIKFADKIC